MRKPKRNAVADTTPDQPPLAVTATDESAPPSLEHIRAHSLRAQSDAARTISEIDDWRSACIRDLEAWRTEVDATIAFLKAQRR